LKRQAGMVATAPTRIDLAGGTLDIWPLSVLVPGSVTVNLAVGLNAEVRIEPLPAKRGSEPRMELVSLDRSARAVRKLPIDPSRVSGRLALLIRLAASFQPDRSFRMVCRAQAPAGAGLGGSSALGIAAAGALNRFTGAGLNRQRLLQRVLNLETIELRVPTGNQDHLAAVHGGLAAYRHTADGTERRSMEVPSGLAGRLVLGYTGLPRNSGASNWDMFRRYIDGEGTTVRRLEAIAGIAGAMVEALAAGDLDETGRLIGEEGKLRNRLAPSVATPEIRKVASAAGRAGALGVKVCGAGGGGCMVALTGEGRRSAVALAMAAAGCRILDAGLGVRGLQVRALAATRR